MEADLHQLESNYRGAVWGLHVTLQERRGNKLAEKAAKRKTRNKRKKRKHIPDRPAKGSVRFLTGRK